jgi:hypothetical protein
MKSLGDRGIKNKSTTFIEKTLREVRKHNQVPSLLHRMHLRDLPAWVPALLLGNTPLGAVLAMLLRSRKILCIDTPAWRKKKLWLPSQPNSVEHNFPHAQHCRHTNTASKNLRIPLLMLITMATRRKNRKNPKICMIQRSVHELYLGT